MGELSFNTSHVVVYLIDIKEITADTQFQYISCCCLSNAFAPFLHFIIPDFPLFFKLFSYFYQAVSQIPVTASQSLIFLVFPGFVTFSPFFRLVKIFLLFPLNSKTITHFLLL